MMMMTFQTTWTEEVEAVAAANMKRCAEMAYCKSQINHWKDKLKQLQAEHRVHAQQAELRRNPAHWNRLKKNVKFRPEYVKIALLSAATTATQCHEDEELSPERTSSSRGGGGNSGITATSNNNSGGLAQVPALLNDWKLVPTSIRTDPELYLLRLQASPPVNYLPYELLGNRSVMEQVIRSQRMDLLLLQQHPNTNTTNGTTASSSSAPVWSYDREYYKLLLLYNDISECEANRVFRMFHFDIRNDADLILSINNDHHHNDAMTSSTNHDDDNDDDEPNKKRKKHKEKTYFEYDLDDVWQRLLHPSTGCFDQREPNVLLWKNRKDVALHILRQSKHCLYYFTARLRNDVDVVAVALATHGGQLRFASTRLRRNPRLLAIAMSSFPAAILYALRRTKTIARLSAKDLVRVFVSAHDVDTNNPNVRTQCYKLWKELPAAMRNDRSVAMAAYRHILALLPGDEAFSPSFAKDRSFWADLIETTATIRPVSKYNPLRTDIIYDIPFTVKWAFALIPTMLTSTDEIKQWQCTAPLGVTTGTEFWHMVARSPGDLMYHAYEEEIIPNFVYRNKDIMVEACRFNHGMLEAIEDSPLAVDRDIVAAAVVNNPLSALICMKDTAQLLHPDLVADAIRHVASADLWTVFHQLDEDVWIHRDVALAWVESGGEYLEDEFQEEFEDDPDIFLAIAEHSPQDFWHASVELCGDKDYMIQAITLNPSLLREVSSNLLHDFDLNLLAFAIGPELPGLYDVNNSDDFDFLTSFATKVRDQLLLHRAFFAFLLGLQDHVGDDDDDDHYVDANAVATKKKKSNVSTKLSQDDETSMALKKNIASFLAVPRGEDLRLLRCASLHLSQWGF